MEQKASERRKLTQEEFDARIAQNSERNEGKLNGTRLMLFDVSLEGLDLRGVNLQRVVLNNVCFRNCNMTNCNLARASIAKCDFTEVDLKFSNLASAVTRSSSFIYANLTESNFSHACFEQTDLQNAILTRSDLSRAHFCTSSLRNAEMNLCKMYLTDFSGTDLSGANLDFSAWPLWCGTGHVIADARLAEQLAAHFCALNCDDPEYLVARAAILEFATKSHRATELGLSKKEIDINVAMTPFYFDTDESDESSGDE